MVGTMAQEHEKASVTLPRGLLAMVIGALIGGGGWAALSPSMTPAAGAQVRAAAADVSGEVAQVRREVDADRARLGQALQRLEGKIDAQADALSTLRADVAVLKARP